MISLLPSDVIKYMFTFLEPQDLGNVARVCKDWEIQAKANELWKRHCLKCLDDTFPYGESYRDRFKILKNWMRGRYEMETFPVVSEESHNKPLNFCLLKDGTPIETFAVDEKQGISNYIVQNIKDRSTIATIDLSHFKDTKICDVIVDGDFWMALTVAGEILFFNVRSGEFVKKIKLFNDDTSHIERGGLDCIGDAIVVIRDGTIEILEKDLREKFVLSTLNFPWTQTPDHYGVSLTKNFGLLYVTRDLYCYVLSISRKTQAVELFVKERINHFTRMFDDHVAVFCLSGEVKIFKDTGDKLTLTHSFFAFNVDRKKKEVAGKIYAHKNWILVESMKILKIFDFRSGKEFSPLSIGLNAYLSINEDSLLVATDTDDPVCRLYSYALYNFAKLQ